VNQPEALSIRPPCVVHPGIAAGVCGRCGTFVCSACLGRAGICVECAARQQPSLLAVAATILGALSFCSFFPGILAIILGTIELGRIRRGSSPAQGADWARSGCVLGAVGLLLGGILALFVWLN
jgi:hypothetical protein